MTTEVELNGVHPGGTSSLLAGKRIVISGAGPCGLTLARLLQQSGANVRVFELESSSAARNQGGSLDLHEESGQLALRKAGLYEQFLSLSRPEGQEFRVVDKHGKMFVHLQPKDDAATRPEIDRGQLRGLLIDSLAPDTIQWGQQVQGVQRSDEGRLRLTVANGRHVDADLLFGCDGTWSRVRPFVSTTKPYYCGISVVETWISSVDSRHPALAEMVGPGIFFASGDDKGLIAQRNGDGNIRVYVTLRVPEDWTQTRGFDFKQAGAAREDLLKVFDGWSPQLRELLSASEIFIPRPIYTHPTRQAAWLARTDVTLLGDAAHVMPFFTGKGVNLAMLDAIELAHNLTSGEFSSIADAIHAYETTMLDRMAEAIAETRADQDVFISSDAPARVESLLRGRIEASLKRKGQGPEASS